MNPLSEILASYNPTLPKGTERGEVLREISELSGFTIKRVVGMFPQATLKDWYFLRSDAKQARCGAKIAILYNAKEWRGVDNAPKSF